MKCQNTKSMWIQEARKADMKAIIIYENETGTYCWQVKNRADVSREVTTLIEDGYDVIEEIFL